MKLLWTRLLETLRLLAIRTGSGSLGLGISFPGRVGSGVAWEGKGTHEPESRWAFVHRLVGRGGAAYS